MRHLIVSDYRRLWTAAHNQIAGSKRFLGTGHRAYLVKTNDRIKTVCQWPRLHLYVRDVAISIHL